MISPTTVLQYMYIVFPFLAETPKDTRENEVTKVTFKPKLMTFETEIMEAMGIREDRKPAKTYWY